MLTMKFHDYDYQKKENLSTYNNTVSQSKNNNQNTNSAKNEQFSTKFHGDSSSNSNTNNNEIKTVDFKTKIEDKFEIN